MSRERGGAARLRGFEAPALAGILAAAAVMQGGFHLPQLVVVAAVAGVAAGAALRIGVSRATGEPRAIGISLGFGILAAAVLFSAALNEFPATTWKPLLTIVLAWSVYALATRVAPREANDAVVMAAVVVAVLGLAGVAFHLRTWAFPFNTWRLSSTLTYHNASAALFTIALPAALSGRTPRHRAGVVLLAVALAATQSRAGIAAGTLAVAMFLILCRAGRDGLGRIAAASLIGLASLTPAIIGEIPTVASAIIAVAGLTAACFLAAREPRSASSLRARRGLVIAATVATIIVGVVALLGPARGRLSIDDDGRFQTWRATAKMIAEHPLAGTGPGTYRLALIRDGRPAFILHAHNEFLEWGAETGVVGLAALGAALALFVRELRRARRRVPRLLHATAVASGIAFLAHSCFDFLWHVPVLVASVAVLLAGGVAPDRDAVP